MKIPPASLKYSLRSVMYILFASMLFACDKHNVNVAETSENDLLKNIVFDVSKELEAIGFFVDCNQIKIEVKDAQSMKTMFNEISDEARHEIRSYSPLGPIEKTALNEANEFEDGASSRLAFYDPNSRSIVFRKGSLRSLTKGYLAHELAHAYQDQKWGFNKIWAPYQEQPSRELFNVTQFIIEGHAELVRHAYEQNLATNSMIARERGVELGKMSEVNCLPCHSKQTLATLPYTFGTRFLLNQYRAGGWPLVEKFFTEPPLSTEQIIHEDKFDRDLPTLLSLPSWEEQGTKLEPILNGSLGEAFLLAKLLSMPLQPELAFTGASGWDGDVAQLYQLGDGREAMLWRILLDRVDDAQELEQTIKDFGEDSDVFRVGRLVDWIITKHPELKKSLRIFLSKHPVNIEANAADVQSTIAQELSIKNDTKLFRSPYFIPRVFIGPKS